MARTSTPEVTPGLLPGVLPGRRIMVTETRTVREILIEAADEALANSFNGDNRFMDALSDWWRSEASAHFHIEGVESAVCDLPGMDQTPAVRAAQAFLEGDR